MSTVSQHQELQERTVRPDGDHSMRNISLIRSISCKRALEMSIACFCIGRRAEVVHLCGIALIDLSRSGLHQCCRILTLLGYVTCPSLAVP
jgi:hypothetical protein